MKKIIILTLLALISTTLLAKGQRYYAGTLCLFGNNQEEILNSPNLRVTLKEELYRISRIYGFEDEILLVKKAELHITKKNTAYIMYFTFDDAYDGGNTIGWIEDSKTLDVVAEIRDSEIFRCKVRQID